MKTIKVTDDKRYLCYSDGEPFFYMGDTAWELFHALDKDEAVHFLTVRKEQKFNVIQAVALAELDGLRKPNAYGRTPLLKDENGKFDPTKPDESGEYSYWDHVEFIINEALKREIFIGLLPTWGDKFRLSKNLEMNCIFNAENAYIYAKWIADRFKKYPNIIWILGGDRYLTEQIHFDVIDSMGKGLKEISPEKMVTFHPQGPGMSIDCVANKDYIDFNFIQSGHALTAYDSYLMLRKTREAEAKPFMDGETRYEGMPANFDWDLNLYWTASAVRNNTYWNILEGACGNTHGHQAIWRMNVERIGYCREFWYEVLDCQAANEVKYISKLRLSRDYFSLEPMYDLVENDGYINNYMAAAKGKDYAFIYSPQGLPIKANLQLLDWGMVKASWYNPRTGEETIFNVLPNKKTVLTCPIDTSVAVGEFNDWILILDKHDKKKKKERVVIDGKVKYI